ncbi:LysR family transcriptional regulator [Agarilytica rhodophyticola]|uniref:LysR family transcriptional regulator n=1 Tax=Agarilytica rhodophyticola TaxID=1737490 RepID=UPI000CD88175|nr:LysR family transcriptional regulator [Agarilytica rhodophyticola]
MIERMHLRIMLEIDRQGSLTAAADKLNLTQSALSHTIKKLEAKFALSLWRKEGRQIQLTEAGHYLLREARRLLPQLERIDESLQQYAKGESGNLSIGMECHPCYQWLLTVVHDFLEQFPGVDVDVKQQFQFGGMAALFNHDIDVLVTPDPLLRKGISFVPVFDYEQVLVVGHEHPFYQRQFIEPEDLLDQVLYTYPVDIERLDIYSLFLLPANCRPQKHKTVEATEIMLQLVAAHRGVATLPRWLVDQFAEQLPIKAIALGKAGVYKQIHLGMRTNDDSAFAHALVALAKKKSAVH